MNKFAFKLSSISLSYLSGLSKANIHIHGKKNIPKGSNIYTANHFTRIETIFLPYHINLITRRPVWSLAAQELFEVGFLRKMLTQLGAVSTSDPHRDDLVISTLLSRNAEWIIFPEGMMVKDKKTVKKNSFMLSDGRETRRPHTGAAALALRCEFYRERIRRMKTRNPAEYDRLIDLFNITDVDRVLAASTFVVPVNITYYPEISRENILSRVIQNIIRNPSKRLKDEVMTEGAMIFSGVDIDIRFGTPIAIAPYLHNSFIESDLSTRRKIKFDDKISSRPVMRQRAVEIMEKYMAGVYSMTTVNYDHVMAGILKHFPYRADGIDLYEFKCKVYLAVLGIARMKDCYFYKSFNENQAHLLISDPYNRFTEFFNTAVQTDVISISKDRMTKDQTKFVSRVDFHSIRIENPLRVITNEIEPLASVENFLKATAQMPQETALRHVRYAIENKMRMDFDDDYAAHYIENESKDRCIGQPFFLRNRSPAAGVLLIHGYMAAPAEMARFAQYLYDRSFTVMVPRLKGHGTSPEDLAETSWRQWIESVEEAYLVLKHTCSTLFIGGFSTGAGLALELCTRIDDYHAVFAVAPPMQLNDIGSYVIPAIDTWNQVLKKMRLDAMATEFLKNSPENPHINYTRNPISGIFQLEKLMAAIEPKLKQIKKPALVVQSRKDPVVKISGTGRLFKKIGSDIKEYYIVDFDRHGILLNDGAGRVYQVIENFLRQFVPGK